MSKPPKAVQSSYISQRTPVCSQHTMIRLVIAHLVFPLDTSNALGKFVIKSRNISRILNANRPGLAALKNTTNCDFVPLLLREIRKSWWCYKCRRFAKAALASAILEETPSQTHPPSLIRHRRYLKLLIDSNRSPEEVTAVAGSCQSGSNILHFEGVKHIPHLKASISK